TPPVPPECYTLSLHDALPISLKKSRIITEAIDEDFVLSVEELVQEAIQGALRFVNLVARHAAAGVERNAETHRHAFRAEVRDFNRLVVFVHEKILSLQSRHESSADIGH